MGNPSPLKPPIISVVGLSGSGKTTLTEKLIREFKSRGLAVATIKHSCHPHPLDAEGKDSWRHKQAGAERTLFVGPESFQLVADIEKAHAPSPEGLAQKYLSGTDIVIVEGFVSSRTEKIEVVRSSRSNTPVCTPEDGLIAVATDLPTEEMRESGVRVFEINDAAAIAEFIIERLFAGQSRDKEDR